MKRVLLSFVMLLTVIPSLAQQKMEALASACEAQLGLYTSCDSPERSVDEYGLISDSRCGCCIDVLLRAWHVAVAVSPTHMVHNIGGGVSLDEMYPEYGGMVMYDIAD